MRIQRLQGPQRGDAGLAQVPEAAQQMKKFEARVTKLRQTPGLDADPDVKEILIMTMILLIRMMMENQTSVFMKIGMWVTLIMMVIVS